MAVLSSPGPVNWELAAQVAGFVAADGVSEPPSDSPDRRELADLSAAAAAHVGEATALDVLTLRAMEPITRQGWVDLHLVSLRPVLEVLASAMRTGLQHGSPPPSPESTESPDSAEAAGVLAAFGFPPGMDPLAGMMGMLAPMLLGMQAGSMIGYLAQHSLGRYDLPLPESDQPSLCMVTHNVDDFERSWSIPRADLRFMIVLYETVRAGQRAHSWVRDRLVAHAREYVSAYEMDPQALEDHLGRFDPQDPSGLAALAEDPEAFLGALQSDRQRTMLAVSRRLTTALEGYADVVVGHVAERLLPEHVRIREALARHHAERGEAGRFIEGLLGLSLTRNDYERGRAFCLGIVDRAGFAGLDRLWEGAEMVPTEAELAAPGLWLARIDLPQG